MVIHHVSGGTLRPIGRMALHGEGKISDRGAWVCHCLVLQFASKTILIEAGLGDGPGRFLSWALGWPEKDHALAMNLAEIGIAQESVSDIVLSHLDFDTAGGVASFPGARLHVRATEYEAATGPQSGRAWRYQSEFLRSRANWRLYRDEDAEWFGMPAINLDTDENMLLVPLPGHSAGHCGIAIWAGASWILHAGDAIMHRKELKGLSTNAPFGVELYKLLTQKNGIERDASEDRVRKLALMHGDEIEIVCYRDAEVFVASREVEDSRPSIEYLRDPDKRK
jgi:glyoxylase-like metal-dependent hydrolase (beta-lactamase superfamily II)